MDACLCEDSDVFLYGAKKVYRKLDLKEEVTSKLGKLIKMSTEGQTFLNFVQVT